MVLMEVSEDPSRDHDGTVALMERQKRLVDIIMSVSVARVDNDILAVIELYYMAKPYNASVLLERLKSLDDIKESAKDLSESLHEMTIEEKVSRIFINVGIPPHIKGYSFLREGVLMAIREPEIINNITKKLYPKIGEKYQTSASKVERAIRHAIEVAWNRGRIESINSILGVRAYVGAEKPTNGEFIALIADKMLLEKA